MRITLVAVTLLGLASCTAAVKSLGGVSSSTDKTRILAQHNSLRKQYGAKALTWSVWLAAAAQKSANRCEMSHDIAALRSKNYGENLSMGVSTWQQAIQLWSNERGKYNWGTATFQSNAGHFTQMVWKATKKVGCAKSKCGIWSCQYWPAGNYIGAFRQNVGR